MAPLLDFEECLKDSPKFRADLEAAETEIDQLGLRLQKITQLCTSMMAAGKVYHNANRNFVDGLKSLNDIFREDGAMLETLEQATDLLEELQKFLSILLDQAHRSICKGINTFVREEIAKVWESKKVFEKISDDLDQALVRNAQSCRSKQQECEEAHSLVTAMNSCFSHTALDYAFQINLLRSRRRYELLDILLSYLQSQSTYFHQGYDQFEHMDSLMRHTASKITEFRSQSESEERRMEERHNLVQKKEEEMNTSQPLTPGGHGVRMEGYLFKRTSNAFKTWHRRWFIIQNNQLVYRKRCKDNLTIMEEDLRLCTVKPLNEIERRFCFEVVSPTKSHVLQSDNEQLCQAWITTMTASIGAAFRDTLHMSHSESAISQTPSSQNGQLPNSESSPSLEQAPSSSTSSSTTAALPRVSLWQKITSIAGNQVCADCGSPDPRWASINLGVTLCIECSGIHRSLGVHISKVRSLTLDAWEPELLKVMSELGNNVVNKIYEACSSEKVTIRATPDCERGVREAWIKAKYMDRCFVKPLPKSPGNFVKSWSVRKYPRHRHVRQAEEGPKMGLTLEALKKCSSDSLTQQSSEEVTDSAAHNLAEVTQNDTNRDVPISTQIGDSLEILVFGTLQDTYHVAPNLEGDSSSTESINSYGHLLDDPAEPTHIDNFSSLTPELLLYRAAACRNLPVMLEAISYGAKVNWVNSDEDGQLALHQAVHSGSIAATEFLLLNGAKIDNKDNRGQTALHVATSLSHTGQVCQLIKRGANLHNMTVDGEDALSIALSTTNADIVTMLRLAKLNEEMRETEGYGNPGDQTFTDVFKDFSNMANNDPDRLERPVSTAL